MDFPEILDRFLRYVRVDTQSSEESQSYPSTEKQKNLGRILVGELKKMGVEQVEMNTWGYVLGILESNAATDVPTIALIAHMDTSPDVSGENVNPQIHQNYNGHDIELSENGGVVLKVAENPYLKEKIGHTLITSDGSTLLGADNKAGICEIMTALDYLLHHPEIPRPKIRILFTPDEEVGRGTENITAEEIAADYGYTIDGEKLGEIEDETFCADSVDIVVNGVNVHPGYAKNKLINSVKIAAEIVDLFPGDSLSPETTENREGYIHPHQISGGVESSVIKVLIRDFEEAGLKEKEDFIRNIVSRVQQRHKNAKIEVNVKESYRNMKLILNKHPEVLEKAVEAIKRAGITPEKSIIRGGTDGARLSFMGLPTPNVFTGGSNFHSKYEWITLEDMKKAAEVIVHLMEIWAS